MSKTAYRAHRPNCRALGCHNRHRRCSGGWREAALPSRSTEVMFKVTPVDDPEVRWRKARFFLGPGAQAMSLPPRDKTRW